MRKELLLFVIPLLLLSVLAVPTVSADPLYVHEAGSTSADLIAGDSAQFKWVIYNNDTVPYLLDVSPALNGASDGVKVSVDQNATVLDPGDHALVVATVSTHRDVGDQDVVLTVVFTMTKLNDYSFNVTREESAHISIQAMFESSGNRIFGIWQNDLPSPFNGLTWSFLITVVVWVAIAGFIYFVINPIVHQFTKKTKTELDDRILEVTRMPIFILIVLFGLVDSLAILNIPTEWHIQIWQAYQIMVALVAAWVAYRIFDKVVIYYADKWSKKTDNQLDDVLVPLMHKLGLIAIPIVGLVLVLNVIGVDVTLLVAGMGVVGLVVAFAAQETLGNLFSGIQLLMDRPFKVGDLVELDTGEVCEVVKIGLRSTQLYNTYDSDMIILPNNDVANKKVVNWSRPDNHRCIWAEVGVAYGSDLAKVEKVLLDIVNNHPDVVKQKGQMAFVRLSKFGDSSIVFRVWYWVDDVRKMWRVNHEVKNLIDKRFREAGIEMPFPQTVVTFKNSPPKNLT